MVHCFDNSLAVPAEVGDRTVTMEGGTVVVDLDPRLGANGRGERNVEMYRQVQLSRYPRISGDCRPVSDTQCWVVLSLTEKPFGWAGMVLLISVLKMSISTPRVSTEEMCPEEKNVVWGFRSCESELLFLFLLFFPQDVIPTQINE